MFRPDENGGISREMPGSSGFRVGYVVKKYPRLSETFILDEILELEAAGLDVSVFSLRLPDEGRFHSELAAVRASISYLPVFGSHSALGAFRALERLAEGGVPDRLSRALRFLDLLPEERRAGVLVQALHLAGASRDLELDHLHAHFVTVASHAAYLAHVFTDIPFSVTAHAKDIYRDTVDMEVFREVAQAATAMVTVCEANREYIAQRLLDQDTRMEVIYNGIRLDELAPSLRARRRNLILAVGRLVEKKGYHVLLEACRILADRDVDFECIVAGDGDERSRLLADRGRLGLDEFVHLPGATTRNRILEWMREARVLAAPCVVAGDGNRDALPTVLLEALALGLPAVATPVGGIPEIVEPGVEGFLVPVEDPAALAGAITLLLQDDLVWQRMSASGPAKAATRFDRKRNITHLLDVFGRTAGGGTEVSLAPGPKTTVAGP